MQAADAGERQGNYAQITQPFPAAIDCVSGQPVRAKQNQRYLGFSRRRRTPFADPHHTAIQAQQTVES
jgi:hypothetical protein